MPNENRDRIVKNIKTTAIGVPILLFGVFMIVMKVLCAMGKSNQCNYSVQDILMTFGLGYTLLMAKDSILEGLLLGFFKKK